MSAEIYSLKQRLIKSCATTEVESLEIGELGPKDSRRWMVVDAGGKFMLSDKHPKMAWIEPSVERDNVLVLTARNSGRQLDVPIRDTGPRQTVEMFNSEMRYEAVDDGDEAAAWLGEVLNVDGCRLVHMPANGVRTDSRGLAKLAFADSWSMSLGSDASLGELNRKIEENGHSPVSEERFGHDVWVTGVWPFEEDKWGEIQIGSQNIAVVKPIVRCARTLIRREAFFEDELLTKDKEPLRTLSQFRRDQNTGQTIFGQKLAPGWDGELHTIRVGDKVEVLVYKAPPVLR